MYVFLPMELNLPPVKTEASHSHSPVPEAQGEVPLPHVSGWVHAGEEPEVWVPDQGLCDNTTTHSYITVAETYTHMIRHTAV